MERGFAMSKELSLRGCFPPIPTPFDLEGDLALDRLAQNLERWKQTPLRGFVVLGSNGEAVHLTEEEKLAVWKTSGEVIGNSHLFIAGSGAQSTRETLELTEKAAALGAHAAMVVTPHYYKGRMDHAALVQHYTLVADRSPIPVILYNVPGFTGVDMTAETIVELASHPNIIGVKESSGNIVKISQIIRDAPPAFQVLAGSGSFLLPSLLMGAAGGVMALSAVAPHLLAQMMEAFKQGDVTSARDIQLRLLAPNAAVTTRFGIAGLKRALDLIGMYGGPVRPPLRPLQPQEETALRGILDNAGML